VNNEPDYPTWVASKLPDVTYDRKQYWQALAKGETLKASDQFRHRSNLAETRWQIVNDLHGHVITEDDERVYEYRRPIPRPTERLLEAMREGEGGRIYHPLIPYLWDRNEEIALSYLTACEHSCQAEPGDGKPVPQEMGEEADVPRININDVVHVRLTEDGRRVLRNHEAADNERLPAGLSYHREVSEDGTLKEQLWELMKIFGREMWNGGPVMFVNCEMELPKLAAARQTIASRQQQVAGLTEELSRIGDIGKNLMIEIEQRNKTIAAITARATAAEAERDRLREALAWYEAQARLCRLIHADGDTGRQALSRDGGEIARAALSPAESSPVTEGGAK
jgi:hypothetical protein